MIELPEATTIAVQMNTAKGKQTKSAIRGHAPHKFAFYTRQPEECATILRDRRAGESIANGSMIMTSIEPDHVLVLGGDGERILCIPNGSLTSNLSYYFSGWLPGD